MTSLPEPKLRVAIVGGGVGGIMLAHALSKADDIQVDIYEAATRLAEIGAGVGMFWRAQRILTDLGLKDDVVALGTQFHDGYAPAYTCRRADQPRGEDILRVQAKGGMTAVHRAEFYTVVMGKLVSNPRFAAHTSKRLQSYSVPSPDAPIDLTFADGTTAEADVVIGSDGLRSVTRAVLYETLATETGDASLRDHIRAKFSGLVSYRTVIPRAKLEAINPQHTVFSSPMQYVGKHKHMIAYPISNGRLINLAMFSCSFDQEHTEYTDPWVAKADAAEVAKLFSGWEPDVEDLMAAIQGLDVGSWVVNVVKPLPVFAHERVALLGDAAHAMTPTLGAGAGQAIEDAYVLASLLGHLSTTRENVARALAVYSKVRVPSARLVVEMSHRNNYLSALHTPGEEQVPLPEIGERMQQCWEAAHGRADPIEDVHRAVKMLETGDDA